MEPPHQLGQGHKLSGFIKPTANAWANTVVWGSAKTLATDGDNIVLGHRG